MMNSGSARAVLMGTLGSLGVAILWTTLAALKPTTNYHLSPLISVLAAPMVARLTNSRRLRWPIAITTAGIGVMITVATAIIIHAAGWALGPSFSPRVPPLVELIAVIVVGALVGAAVAVAPLGEKADSQDSALSKETRSSSSSTDH
jgi:hypothetical protein